MSQISRIIIGTAFCCATVANIISLNTLTYFEQNIKKQKKLLTLVNIPFSVPSEGDLVLIQDNQTKQFKIVQTSSGKYSAPNKVGYSMYVPPGFLMLRDPSTNQLSLQSYGSVLGQYNFDMSWLMR